MTWWRGARTKGAACAPGVLTLLVALAIATDARAQQKVDLELVLAVDVSSSVSDEEFHLQMTGLSAAFRHPLVVAAISQSGDWGVAVAVVQWASGDEQVLSVDWSRIRNEAEAAALSARIAEAPRLFAGGDTSLGGAIGYAAQLFEGNGFRGLRRVIDISGDGGGGYGQSLAKSIAVRGRDRALAKGITINGLAILNEDPTLDVFFRDNVIGGAGSFVITVESYRDFATAIAEKLIREIGDRPLAADRSFGRRRS